MSCRRRMSGFNYESGLSERTPRFAPHRCRMANGTSAPLLRNDRTVSGGHPKHRRTRQTERTKTPTNIPPSRRFGNRPFACNFKRVALFRLQYRYIIYKRPTSSFRFGQEYDLKAFRAHGQIHFLFRPRTGYCIQNLQRNPFLRGFLFTIHFQRNLSSASCLVLVKKTQFGITVGIGRHGRLTSLLPPNCPK